MQKNKKITIFNVVTILNEEDSWMVSLNPGEDLLLANVFILPFNYQPATILEKIVLGLLKWWLRREFPTSVQLAKTFSTEVKLKRLLDEGREDPDKLEQIAKILKEEEEE